MIKITFTFSAWIEGILEVKTGHKVEENPKQEEKTDKQKILEEGGSCINTHNLIMKYIY